ncbi:MAG: hypothetical protein HUJ42_00265 [Malacoplasma sp.]|nr:hypothetical protein [Malacoplasma sp.]
MNTNGIATLVNNEIIFFANNEHNIPMVAKTINENRVPTNIPPTMYPFSVLSVKLIAKTAQEIKQEMIDIANPKQKTIKYFIRNIWFRCNGLLKVINSIPSSIGVLNISIEIKEEMIEITKTKIKEIMGMLKK